MSLGLGRVMKLVGVSLFFSAFSLSLEVLTVSSSARLWWLWLRFGYPLGGFFILCLWFQCNGADKVSRSGSVIVFMHETLYYCIQL